MRHVSLPVLTICSCRSATTDNWEHPGGYRLHLSVLNHNTESSTNIFGPLFTTGWDGIPLKSRKVSQKREQVHNIIAVGSPVKFKSNGPLLRYVNLRVVLAPRMPGTFFPPPRVSNPGKHHGTGVAHVPGFMPGSLTNGSLWRWWRRKRSRHSRCMRNPQFYVFCKRPIETS